MLTGEELREIIDARPPARGAAARAVGHGAGVPLPRRRRGEIGFINPVSEPFCSDCNRIRLTADGKLRTCLFSLHETDLREPLRDGASDDELERDHPRRRLAQGAQAPRERAGLPPAGPHDVRHRRLRRSTSRACAAYRTSGRSSCPCCSASRWSCLHPRGRPGSRPRSTRCSVAGLFGVSAVYHRVSWKSVSARAWMRRLDHTMIFVLIAGSYTPFALLVLEGTLATVILVAVWTGSRGGRRSSTCSGSDAPKWLIAIVYVLVGWVAVAAFPDMIDELGVTPTAMVAAGGVLYTLGAVVYARRKPDPVPSVFGYHEVFHALVIAAAALQYAVIAFFVLASAGLRDARAASRRRPRTRPRVLLESWRERGLPPLPSARSTRSRRRRARCRRGSARRFAVVPAAASVWQRAAAVGEDGLRPRCSPLDCRRHTAPPRPPSPGSAAPRPRRTTCGPDEQHQHEHGRRDPAQPRPVPCRSRGSIGSDVRPALLVDEPDGARVPGEHEHGEHQAAGHRAALRRAGPWSGRS